MILTLNIPNWTKYNPRTDVKSSSWFRMNNDFFMDSDFYGATYQTRLTWIFIKCQASRKNNPEVKINLAMACDQTKFSREDILDAILALIEIGCVQSEQPIEKPTRSDSIVHTMSPSATNVRTDVTNETNILSPSTGVTGSPESSGDAVSDIKPSAAITLLNEICGRQFKPATQTYQKLARARLREGWTLSDMKMVFEYKFAEWGDNPDMAKHLNPDCLLGNKFQKYLQAAQNQPTDFESQLKNSLDEQILAAGLPAPMRKAGAR